jgi:hypothetical protein
LIDDPSHLGRRQAYNPVGFHSAVEDPHYLASAKTQHVPHLAHLLRREADLAGFNLPSSDKEPMGHRLATIATQSCS